MPALLLCPLMGSFAGVVPCAGGGAGSGCDPGPNAPAARPGAVGVLYSRSASSTPFHTLEYQGRSPAPGSSRRSSAASGSMTV
ncbi:hypothetical protein GCM10023329_43770 [Streptomyces sanyensis]|uniref:Secreted protein n=1 Tax=Streptomyces sanyensis TaxID=568869 RepID=A0ABP9B1A3_9ACTN